MSQYQTFLPALIVTSSAIITVWTASRFLNKVAPMYLIKYWEICWEMLFALLSPKDAYQI